MDVTTADRVLRQMSEYLEALDAYSFRGYSTMDDVPPPGGEKIQLATMLDRRLPTRPRARPHAWRCPPETILV